MSDDAMPPALTPVLDFLRILWRVNHGIERHSRRMQRTIGVTAQQRMVVRLAGRFPNIVASELASLLHVDRGTLSASLARLESAKVITRKVDRSDRRRVHVRLTAKGRALNRDTRGTLEGAVAEALARDPAVSFAQGRHLLSAIAQALEGAEHRS